jgi:hypothetical protein
MNRIAVNSRLRRISPRSIGHQPSRLNAALGEEPPFSTTSQSTTTEQTIQEPVTVRIRARMTDGASRLRLGEGRVYGER